MGQLPKSKIEQLKREKREAKAAKKRKVATRDKIVRFLIVCEGERTEPNYFKELVKDRYSEVRSEEIVGKGRSTCALVKRTEEIKEVIERQRQLRFDRVWVVFDKDDFNDFNEAIALAEKKGYKAAWSNEAYPYQTNDTGIYDMLMKIGNETQAKLRAARLRSMFDNARDFKSHKPCTCVDILVEELEHPENLLNGI